MYLCKRVTLADMEGAAQFRSIADTPTTIFRVGGVISSCHTTVYVLLMGVRTAFGPWVRLFSLDRERYKVFNKIIKTNQIMKEEMKKKTYVSPQVEVVETRVQDVLCGSNYPGTTSGYDYDENGLFM